MNTGDLLPDLDEAELRVHGMQTKLHQWAISDPGRCFDDLYNLVCDPAFLVVAWSRVKGNKGARSAGVDGVVPRSIVFGAGELLGGLRDDLKARRFFPMPGRETMIPKANGKLRRLGIPTATARVVQASLKLVLEPIFEADFKPCSYGFRPKRRAQDAIAVNRPGFVGGSVVWLRAARIGGTPSGIVPYVDPRREDGRRCSQAPRSPSATGSEQCGHEPPGPIRRQNRLQSSQRRVPR